MQASPNGHRSAVRGDRMRELRRAATSHNESRAVDHIRPAADLDRDAKAASDRLREALKAGAPWIKDVEVHRQRCRDLLLTLLFGHPLSTHAQSLEPLWHHTTYSLISAYRALVANLEAQLPPSHGGRKKQGPSHAELKKVLTRFRLVLASEDTFYRSLISRLVGFYSLQSFTREYLSAISIGVPDEVPNGGPEEGLAPRMSHDERREKVGLVYKALVCLGDLERYKEQYDDKNRRDAREPKGAAIKGQERFNKAWTYYEVARSMIPDDGSAFNQLAVISTYLNDDFLCLYYYIRAMAVKNAFKNIHEILDKFLRKVFERWMTKVQRRRREGSPSAGEEEEVEKVETDVLLLVAILFRRNGLSSIPKIEAQFIVLLQSQLSRRQLSSEVIVKITAILIGNHWQSRQAASIAPPNEDPSITTRRHESETISLRILLGVYAQILNVSATEVEEALRSRASGSAVSLGDTEPQLHVHISAVLRRLLPALRILSKWLKLHIEYITRSQRNGQLSQPIAQFWDSYTRLVVALATLFPIDQLPSLTQPLEEDIDMKGFIPLAWGMNRSQGEGGHDFHPNEEQLMRIADLQVDAKLLAQSSSGGSILSPRMSTHRPLPAFGHPGAQERQDDIASVSTETEDDPVNMAMRATLGGSSTDGESVRDDTEEVIVWNGRPGNNTAPPHPSQHHSSRPSYSAPTAQDLFQTLTIDPHHGQPITTHHTRSQPQTAVPRHSPSLAQPGLGQQNSAMLFGGDVMGSSIWTMTREESDRGKPRTANVDIASIWGAPEPSPQGGAQGGWSGAGPVGAAGGQGGPMGAVNWGHGQQWNGAQQYPR